MIKRLDIQEIHFGEDVKYLEQLEPFKTNGLETNNIYHKTIPGFGATTLEIISNRNSIIIEPHKPVIVGKQAKHPHILGVYKEISNKKIRDYLKSETMPKKIMTTPEGYSRVVTILNSMKNKFDLYKDFFLLFDECDRLITDVNYRSKISFPMNNFFKFKNKALISATAIMPSDKRFKTYNFKIVKLVPDFEYKKEIKVIVTNNIVDSLRIKLSSIDNEKPVFIFLNSTLTIKAIIDICDYKEKSKIFCSEDSRTILGKLDVENTSSNLGDYSKYNFFTSRFFSAVDIDLDYKPDIILISDLMNAKHSMLDPSTEVIQISGRFRRPEGSDDRETTKSITHITNLNPSIKYWGRSQAKQYLNTLFNSYKEKSTKLANAIEQQLDEVEIHTLGEELKKLPFNDYIKLDGEIDYFLVDNYLHKQRVKSHYVNVKSLENAYKSSDYFKGEIKIYNSLISDEDNIKLSKAKTNIALTEIVAERLVKLTAPLNHTVFDFTDRQAEIKFLHEKFPHATRAFFLIGIDAMREKEFKLHKMNGIVNKETVEQAKVRLDVISQVFEEFEVGKFYTEEEIRTSLQSIYDNSDIICKAVPKNLTLYFEISTRTSKSYSEGERGHDILSSKEVSDIQKE